MSGDLSQHFSSQIVISFLCLMYVDMLMGSLTNDRELQYYKIYMHCVTCMLPFVKVQLVVTTASSTLPWRDKGIFVADIPVSRYLYWCLLV